MIKVYYRLSNLEAGISKKKIPSRLLLKIRNRPC